MAGHEVEDLKRHLEASRHRCGLLQRQFEDTNDHLKVAHLDVRHLETENDALRAYEEEYQRNQVEFIRINASREIHISYVEGCLQEFKSRVVKLYQEKLEAEDLVAQARRQGFLPATSVPQAQ